MIHTNGLNDRVSVVIRSAGERTEFLCKELVLAEGILEENITIIKKTPFSLALQASYEAGITFNRPWTLCLDADVLLLPDSIQEMADFAGKQKPSIFEIQGLVLDKFFGGPREAGNHLYRTALLSQALKFIPQEKGNIRPEQNTINAMRSQGFPRKLMNHIVGVHDFEQYYADIFRKSFIYAHKFRQFAEIVVSYWPQQGIMDPDYKIALKGFVHGLEHKEEVQIDARREIYRELFENLQIVEKPELPSGSFSSAEIALLVKNWVEPPIYHKYFHFGRNRTKELTEKKRKLGPFKYVLYLFGWGIEKAGLRITEIMDKQG